MAGSRFGDALSGEEEIQITIVRSKDGKKLTLPIWFTIEGERLQLLPMHGLKRAQDSLVQRPREEGLDDH